MEWQGETIPSLWRHLQSTEKQIVLYGMGNGADKILRVCEEKSIPVCGVFASDSFAKEKLFHGMHVCKWQDVKERFGAENVIVLLSFGSSLPEVLENILRIASEAELYAPDVPAFGDGLFDEDFAERHREELERARALLSDEESRKIFDLVLRYKLSGDIRPLLEARSDFDKTARELIRPTELTAVADLGAYNGDTARELLDLGAHPARIFAMEPDARSFRKLSDYAAKESRCEILPIRAAAWSHEETLLFDASGNRNSSASQNRSESLDGRPAKFTELPALPLDGVLNGAQVDYIKYDVEGSEREALIGSRATIQNHHPTLMVSLYHRNEDLFALALFLHEFHPEYKGYYLRRFGGVPAWDLNLYVRKEPIDG